MPDTCDRCGANAKFTVLLPSGGSLSFCGHHQAEYQEALTKAGAVIVKREELAAA